MKKTKQIWSILPFLWVTSVFSVELSESDYQQTFKQLSAVANSEITSISSLKQRLETEPEVSKIILTHQALSILSDLSELTDEQKKWVNSLTSSKQILSIISADHPRKRMIIVDVSRQASITMQLWEINQQVQQLEHKWLSADWQWADLVKPANAVKKQALLLWLTRASFEKALEIGHYLERNPMQLSALSNDVLAVIAQQASSNALFAELWSRSADHVVYAMLNRLATNLSDDDAISQLKLATDNPQLVSQALFRLSKDYGQEVEAQHFIEQALFDPKLQLQMAMTVSVIQDPKFKDRLRRMLADSNNKTAKIALKQLSKESLQ